MVHGGAACNIFGPADWLPSAHRNFSGVAREVMDARLGPDSDGSGPFLTASLDPASATGYPAGATYGLRVDRWTVVGGGLRTDHGGCPSGSGELNAHRGRGGRRLHWRRVARRPRVGRQRKQQGVWALLDSGFAGPPRQRKPCRVTARAGPLLVRSWTDQIWIGKRDGGLSAPPIPGSIAAAGCGRSGPACSSPGARFTRAAGASRRGTDGPCDIRGTEEGQRGVSTSGRASPDSAGRTSLRSRVPLRMACCTHLWAAAPGGGSLGWRARSGRRFRVNTKLVASSRGRDRELPACYVLRGP